MKKELHAKLTARLFTDEKCFGPGMAELLLRVDELHSLRSAAQAMKMAYSKAWTVLHRAEDALGFPLLEVRVGGKNGGGATLTEQARQMLSAYERYCERLRACSDEIFREEFGFYLNRGDEDTEAG